MQMRSLPRGGQFSVKGNVVNVPVDITPTVTSLPRNMNEIQTIPVRLKRKLQYNKAENSENVRPAKVLNALKWLLHNSALVFYEICTVHKQTKRNSHRAHMTNLHQVQRDNTKH